MYPLARPIIQMRACVVVGEHFAQISVSATIARKLNVVFGTELRLSIKE
jgi:hypothetical protein